MGKSGGLNVKDDHRQPEKSLTRAEGAKTMDSRVSIIIMEFSRSVLHLSSHVQFDTFIHIFIQ